MQGHEWNGGNHEGCEQWGARQSWLSWNLRTPVCATAGHPIPLHLNIWHCQLSSQLSLQYGNTKLFYSSETTTLIPLNNWPVLETSAQNKSKILLQEFSSVSNKPEKKNGWHQHDQKLLDLVLLDLRVHKASGPDKIPNHVLKELAVLTNQSLSTVKTQHDWGSACDPGFQKRMKKPEHQVANMGGISITI